MTIVDKDRAASGLACRAIDVDAIVDDGFVDNHSEITDKSFVDDHPEIVDKSRAVFYTQGEAYTEATEGARRDTRQREFGKS